MITTITVRQKIREKALTVISRVFESFGYSDFKLTVTKTYMDTLRDTIKIEYDSSIFPDNLNLEHFMLKYFDYNHCYVDV